MNPKLGDAKVDKILSQFSQRYSNKMYIAENILLPMKVKEKTGKYAKYGSENLRIYTDALFRAPGTRANSIDYSVSQGTYECRERALEKRVPDEFVDNSDDPYDPKRDATSTIMDNIWANQENALATVMADTAVLTKNTTLAGVDQWSDYTNSDPFDDIFAGVDTMRTNSAQLPNTIAMGYSVMKILKQHPDVREQLKYTGAGGNVSDGAFVQFLKDFFNIQNVLIGTAIKDSADEGQTASLADIWGKHLWLLHINERPTLMQATFGYTFFDVPRKVETYREESHVADVIRVRYSFDQNIMDANLAYLVKNAVA